MKNLGNYKIYYNIKNVIIDCMNQPINNSAFDITDNNVNFYLIPIDNINTDMIFRVFVKNYEFSGISQYYLFNKENPSNITLKNIIKIKENFLMEIINYICKIYLNNIYEKVKNLKIKDFIFDIHLTEELDYYMILTLLPFGKEFSTKSCLFHWKLDEEILYCKKLLNYIQLRVLI